MSYWASTFSLCCWASGTNNLKADRTVTQICTYWMIFFLAEMANIFVDCAFVNDAFIMTDCKVCTLFSPAVMPHFCWFALFSVPWFYYTTSTYNYWTYYTSLNLFASISAKTYFCCFCLAYVGISTLCWCSCILIFIFFPGKIILKWLYHCL